MRVAVLGGTRFIGVALVEELLVHGHEPTVIHRGRTEARDQPDVPHVHVDRHATDDLTEAFGGVRPEAFIDASAYSAKDAAAALAALPEGVPAVALSSQDVYRAFHTFLTGGRALDPVPLDEASPLRTESQRFLFRGRPPIEGSAEDNETYENLDVEAAYLARGATVLRLPMVYGERDLVRREEFILRRVRAGRPRIPIGAGTFLWSRGDVRDVARAIRLAAESKAGACQALNIAESKTWTIAEWARQILLAAGSDAELVRIPDDALPPDMELTAEAAQHMLVSSDRARHLLGWSDSDPLECLRRSVSWHLDHRPAPGTDDLEADDRALEAAERDWK